MKNNCASSWLFTKIKQQTFITKIKQQTFICLSLQTFSKFSQLHFSTKI